MQLEFFIFLVFKHVWSNMKQKWCHLDYWAAISMVWILTSSSCCSLLYHLLSAIETMTIKTKNGLLWCLVCPELAYKLLVQHSQPLQQYNVSIYIVNVPKHIILQELTSFILKDTSNKNGLNAEPVEGKPNLAHALWLLTKPKRLPANQNP